LGFFKNTTQNMQSGKGQNRRFLQQQDHLSTPDIHGAHFRTPPNMDGLGSKGFADKSFDWP
jgi:hypothetical protein